MHLCTELLQSEKKEIHKVLQNILENINEPFIHLKIIVIPASL